METQQRTASRPPQDSQAEEEIAAAIALILAGGAVVASVAGAIASLLRLLPGLPDIEMDDLTASVGRMVSGITEGESRRSEGEISVSAANLSYRAHYAIEATKRVAKSVSEGESVRGALEGERRHLAQHLDACEARRAGAAMNEAAAVRWGPLLSWNHPNTGKDHRPSHVAANGANFDVRRPPQSTEGMLPGQALNCHCPVGPPIPGGRMLN